MLFFLVLPATWFEMCDFKGSLGHREGGNICLTAPTVIEPLTTLFFFFESFSFCLQSISSISSDSSVLVHLILHHLYLDHRHHPPPPPHHHHLYNLYHVSQVLYYSSLPIDKLCFEYLSCSIYPSCSCQNDIFLKTHQPLPVAFCRDGRQRGAYTLWRSWLTMLISHRHVSQGVSVQVQNVFRVIF